MDGPRTIASHELDSLELLINHIFMDDELNAMRDNYPHFLIPENCDHLFVYADQGRIISHVGTLNRWASLGGCTVRIAMMGAVATYDEYRGKGLASQLVQMALEKARQDNIDFMLISGGRSLYTRIGASPVGCDYLARINRETAASLSNSALCISQATQADMPVCSLLYGQRPARFIRPAGDWSTHLTSRPYQLRHRVFLTIQAGAQVVGYVVAGYPNKHNSAEIVEWAGPDEVIAGALQAVAETVGAAELRIQLQWADTALYHRLEKAGMAFIPEPTEGTLVILQFAQLVQRLIPWIEERGGLELAQTVRGEESGDLLTLHIGNTQVTLTRSDMAKAIFGSPQPLELPAPFRQVFPVPTLLYGISYI